MKWKMYYKEILAKYPVLKKKIRINAILAVALLFGAFVLGLSWEYTAHRQEISDILDVAKDTIRHADWFFDGDYNVDAKTMHNEIKCAIKGITALEQKDVK